MHEDQKFALILVLSSHREPLIYRVPDLLSAKVAAGTRVLVPLQKRQVTGIVLSLVGQAAQSDIRDVSEVLDDGPLLDAELLKLAQSIARV